MLNLVNLVDTGAVWGLKISCKRLFVIWSECHNHQFFFFFETMKFKTLVSLNFVRRMFLTFELKDHLAILKKGVVACAPGIVWFLENKQASLPSPAKSLWYLVLKMLPNLFDYSFDNNDLWLGAESFSCEMYKIDLLLFSSPVQKIMFSFAYSWVLARDLSSRWWLLRLIDTYMGILNKAWIIFLTFSHPL